MTEDKIALNIQEINKLREKLKEVKKDIKFEEKIDDPHHAQLKDGYKDLRKQIKEFEDDYLEDLYKDESYKQLLERKIQLEEHIAHEKEELAKHLSTLPQKAHQMKVDTEAGPINVQIQPEMKVYINGKEER